MFDTLAQVSAGLTNKYPHGNEPFQLMTRLLEECGELAQQVNHIQGSGIKREKYGPPDVSALAKEATQVLQCVMQLIQYYHIEDDVQAALEATLHRLKDAGFIEANAQAPINVS